MGWRKAKNAERHLDYSCTRLGDLIVVEPTRQDSDLGLMNLVYKTMLVVDAPRPTTGQFMFERLWFSNADERVAMGFLDYPK